MKILLFDIETTPLEAYSWGPAYETSLIQVFEPMRILSFSAKWLHGSQITKGWMDYPGYKKGVKDDKKLVLELYELVNQCDILVGQNIKAFDIKTMNARFAFYGLTPPKPYKVIDTLLETRKNFRLASNKLDDIGSYFHLGRKTEHQGFPLWLACMRGEKNAWKKMLKYNRQDVLLTEKAYLLLLPWIQHHPNILAGMKCSRCGEDNLQSRGFIDFARKKRRALCLACGGWMSVHVDKVKSM